MATCLDWEDAKAVAKATGWELCGDQVTTIPCIPIPQFMQFLSSLMEGGDEADYRIHWKPHAEEQIEAFLQAGWPEEPQQL